MKYFNEPEMEVKKYDIQDVITTSGEPEENEGWGGGRV